MNSLNGLPKLKEDMVKLRSSFLLDFTDPTASIVSFLAQATDTSKAASEAFADYNDDAKEAERDELERVLKS